MKKFLTCLWCTLLLAGYAFAQDPAPAMFAIYEDNVKPSMDATYKETLKKLKDACDLHKVSFSWTSVAFDDNTYSHLIPIKAFGDLDKNMMADLETKMGKEALGSIFADFNKCIESQTSFVVSMLPNMSYLSPAAGENFREILFWQVQAGKEAEGEKMIMEWINLYKSKNVPSGVVTYKVLFGSEPGYAFVSWGKNKVDHATNAQKTYELVGEEHPKLWKKTQAMTKKYYHKTAWVMTDFSRAPALASD